MGNHIVSLLTPVGGGGGSLPPKPINVPADYPTVAEANNDMGRHYYITGSPSVTDSDPTKTFTGQTFLTGQDIVWDGISAYVKMGDDKLWADDGTDYKTINPRNINLGTSGLKDTNVTTAIKLGDALNTTFATTNQTILGAVNELVGVHGDFVKRDGTTALTADWDAGNFEIRAKTFYSDISTGTAPFSVLSLTKVANLNADFVDGYNFNQSLLTSDPVGFLSVDAGSITTDAIAEKTLNNGVKVENLLLKNSSITVTDFPTELSISNPFAVGGADIGLYVTSGQAVKFATYGGAQFGAWDATSLKADLIQPYAGSAVTISKLSVNSAYIFPTVDGNPNEILKTDGSGNVSWQVDTTLSYWKQTVNLLEPATADDKVAVVRDTLTASDISMHIDTTLTAAVDGVTGHQVTMTGFSGGMTAGQDTFGYFSNLIGDNNDAATARYSAFSAAYTPNSGSAKGLAYVAGENFENLILSLSGSVILRDYDFLMKCERFTDGDGNQLRIEAGTGQHASSAQAGGDLLLYSGQEVNGGVSGSVFIGLPGSSPGLKVSPNQAVTFAGAYTFPTTDAPVSGYVLKSNAAGLVTWQIDTTMSNWTQITGGTTDYLKPADINNTVQVLYSTSSAGSVGILQQATITADVDNTVGIGSKVVGDSSGMSGTNTLYSFLAEATAQAADSGGIYVGYNASDFAKNGGSSNGYGFWAGTGYDRGFYSQSPNFFDASLGIASTINTHVQTTLTAEVDAVVGHQSTMVGYSGGLTGSEDVFGYFSQLNGNANDTDGRYNAFAAAFTPNGGTNTGWAYVAGENFDNLIHSLSGSIDLVNYSAVIQTKVENIDSAGFSLTIKASDGLDSGATPRSGANLNLTAGDGVNGGTDGNVVINRLRLSVNTTDVSNPPTDAELDAIYGTPAIAGSGFTGYINDNGGGTNFYQIVSDGTNWFYEMFAKAV